MKFRLDFLAVHIERNDRVKCKKTFREQKFQFYGIFCFGHKFVSINIPISLRQ